jgi:hypothetical protein
VDGVSLVDVVTELDEGVSVVVDDAVGVVAELKASYFVVGDVNTCAMGSDLDSEDRGGQSPGSVLSATLTPNYIIVTDELVVDLYISACGLPRQSTRDIPEKVVSPEASLNAKMTSFTSLSTVQLVEEADVSPKSSLLHQSL